MLLNAAAFAPEGRAVQALEVRLVGPGLNKRAMITGDRFWVRSFSSFAPSEPLPFVTMPLVWDRAFGGSDLSNVEGPSRNGSEMRNLVGVGFHLNSDDSAVLGAPLPNLERIDEPVRSWSDKPQPIGFGPVGRGWRPRIGFAGTYDQRWMDETLPFLPVDFDERYFQSAPTDQQLTTLSGGTTFGCVHMSSRGRFVARLPSLRVPLRFLFSDRIESRMVTADTLILEPSDARLILLGRASVALPRQFTALREIRVGLPPRPTGDKPRFRGLGEAVAALRRVH